VVVCARDSGRERQVWQGHFYNTLQQESLYVMTHTHCFKFSLSLSAHLLVPPPCCRCCCECLLHLTVTLTQLRLQLQHTTLRWACTAGAAAAKHIQTHVSKAEIAQSCSRQCSTEQYSAAQGPVHTAATRYIPAHQPTSTKRRYSCTVWFTTVCRTGQCSAGLGPVHTDVLCRLCYAC
jgi:hypothetical protein